MSGNPTGARKGVATVKQRYGLNYYADRNRKIQERKLAAAFNEGRAAVIPAGSHICPGHNLCQAEKRFHELDEATQAKLIDDVTEASNKEQHELITPAPKLTNQGE